MKITFKQLFIDALLHPKKHAAFRLLPIEKVIQFIFLLSSFATALSFYAFLTAIGNEGELLLELNLYLTNIKWLLYPLSILFLFVLNTALLFIRITIYSALGLLLLQLFKRRGEYRMIWRTATFNMTFGFIVSTVLSYTTLSSAFLFLFSVIFTFAYLITSVLKYPKKPIAKKLVPLSTNK